MKAAGRRQRLRPTSPRGNSELRTRLSEAQETLHAIQSGRVDALVVAGRNGPRVYTLEGAEHRYRVLMESMNEGALILEPSSLIVYANHSFARMVKRPLEQVLGLSFRSLLAGADRAALRLHSGRGSRSGTRFRASLHAGDGSFVPVQISTRPLPQDDSRRASYGMVVTDISAIQRSQEQVRVLSHRLAQAQEAERDAVAHQLSDDVAQSLVAILFRLQALLDRLPASEWPARGEVAKLSGMLGETADGVERISRSLRPSILVNLGLVAALRAAGEEFAERTEIRVKLACAQLSPRPPPEAKLAIYRVFEEALKNIEEHGHARNVTVRLTQRGALAELSIKDDGIGFDPDHLPARRKREGLGLLRMRERAAFMGGLLTIKSARRSGTEIKLRIPLSKGGDGSA